MNDGANYEKMAESILQIVGGKENVSLVAHCMTRLRLNLNDSEIPDMEELKKVKGVLGVVTTGDQFQIIIGQTVDKVYEQICKIGGFETRPVIAENLDKKKEKITPKYVGLKILDALAGCVTPLIPMLMAASVFKVFIALLGPLLLNVISEKSDLYILLTFVGDAGFYFFPIAVGYTAAKKFNVTPILAIFLGGIMIHPTLIDLASKGKAFTVFGIPASLQNYASTLLPIILSVWVMSFVEKYVRKIMPVTLQAILAPFITILIMIPLSLCLLGPAGAFVGNYVCKGLLSLSGVPGLSFITVAVIGALWEFLVMSGMHLVMITTIIMVIAQNGSESLICPGALSASLAVAGMALGAGLRIRQKEEKGLAFGYFVACFAGGVTEPALYGIGMKYKRPFIAMMIGGFVGGLYASIMGVSCFVMIPVANFIGLFSYVGKHPANVINEAIATVIALIISAVLTYFFGFKKDDPVLVKE